MSIHEPRLPLVWPLPAGRTLCVPLLALVLCCAGCTHLGLAKKTVLQGSTVSDMQCQQVLDNLAMFSCNPDAMAWHMKITGGLVQLSDTGQGLVGANLGGPRAPAGSGGFSRSLVGQWNLDPVTESGDLELLQIAYKKAIDPFDADGAIKRAAYDQICELAFDYQIALDRRVAFDILTTKEQGATPQRQARLARIRGELDRMYAEIEELVLRVDPYDPKRAMAGGPGDVSTRVDFLKQQVLRLLYESHDNPVGQVRAGCRPGRNVGLVEQAEDKIAALVQLFADREDGTTNPFSIPWFAQGCKQDVPKCACLVGHYCGCGCERYVWITPETTQQFHDFVLIVLALAPPSPDDLSPSQSGLGAANSPTF